MNMQQIRDIAKRHGVSYSRLNKVSLVKTIQHVEGNFDCFATAANGYCDQIECLWRKDCFDSARKLKQ